MKNLQTPRTQMVGYARRETQKAHRIIPEGKCDGGGIGEDDGKIIEGRQAKGAKLHIECVACCKFETITRLLPNYAILNRNIYD